MSDLGSENIASDSLRSCPRLAKEKRTVYIVLTDLYAEADPISKVNQSRNILMSCYKSKTIHFLGYFLHILMNEYKLLHGGIF